MTIGIIGAGNIGGALAKTFGKAGFEAVVANSRGPESIAEFVSTLGETISGWYGQGSGSAGHRYCGYPVVEKSRCARGPGARQKGRDRCQQPR